MAYASSSVQLLRRSPLLLTTLLAIGACDRSPDCTLYGTCAGSLLERAEQFAGADKAEACRTCLLSRCGESEHSCSVDVACHFSSRCKFTKTPSEYQDCLRVLYRAGFSSGSEERFPWEGPGAFGECLHDHCRSECVEDPFACAKTFDEGQAYMEYDIQLEVALRSYPDYKALKDVELRTCEDAEDPNEKFRFRQACKGWQKTDQRGVAVLDVRQHIPASRLYIEIKGQEGNFPKTLYYPGRLGYKDLQLLPIYVIQGWRIELGNLALRRGLTILKDAAQSLVLTDSCVWERISARDLRVEVDDASVQQCHRLVQPCAEDAGCQPCVWYAKDELPKYEADRTDGTGAGVVGLDAGFYTIRVVRGEEDQRVGERKVRMENGAMTIVRTWPPTEQLPSASAEP